MKKINCYNIKKDMYDIDEYGNIFNTHTRMQKSTRVNKRGYIITDLQVVDENSKSVTKTFYIHRLVVATYLDKSDNENATTVNHKDGIKNNNHYLNLEWATYKKQIVHALGLDLYDNIKGEKNYNSVFKEKEIILICKLINKGFTNKQIGKKMDLPKTKRTVNILYNIRNRNKWKDVVNKYLEPKRSTTIEIRKIKIRRVE